MICLKCGGLMNPERLIDFFLPRTLWRCFACGCVLDNQIYRNRQACLKRAVVMPMYLREEDKATWAVVAKRSKSAKKPTENEPTPLNPTPLIDLDDPTVVLDEVSVTSVIG